MDDFHRRLDEAVLFAAEAGGTLVEDIGMGGDEILPPGLHRAHAEIIFLAIAARESLFVEQTDMIHQITTDIEAKAIAGRHVDRFGDLGEGDDPLGPVVMAHIVGLGIDDIGDREGEAARIVAHRRHRARLGRAEGDLAHAVDPAVMDDRVAVEQQDIVTLGPADAAIDGAGIAHILRVHEQVEAGMAGEAIQQRLHQFVAAAIIDHQHAITGEIGFRQHRGQAALDRFGRVIDRHDDGEAAGLIVAQRHVLRQDRREGMAQIVAQHDGRELADDLFTPGGAHGRDQAGILAQRIDARDHRLDILVTDQEAGLAIIDQLGHRAPAIADHRAARGLRLGHGAAEGFGEVGQRHHDVELRHRLGRAVGIARKFQIAGQPGFFQFLDIGIFRADDAEAGVGHQFFGPARDFHEIGDALFGNVGADDAEHHMFAHDIGHVERVDLGDVGDVEAATAVREQLLRRGRIGDDIVGLVQDALDDPGRIHAHAVAQMLVMVDQFARMDGGQAAGAARSDQRIDQDDGVAINEGDVALLDDVDEILDRGFVGSAILRPLEIGEGIEAAALLPQQVDIVGIAFARDGDIDVELHLRERVEHVDEAAFAAEHLRIHFMRAQQHRGRIFDDIDRALTPGGGVGRAAARRDLAAFALAVFDIMSQRIRACVADVGIDLEIAARAEMGRGIAVQPRAKPKIMFDRVHVKDGDIGIGPNIPCLVKQARFLNPRNILRGHSGRYTDLTHLISPVQSKSIHRHRNANRHAPLCNPYGLALSVAKRHVLLSGRKDNADRPEDQRRCEETAL